MLLVLPTATYRAAAFLRAADRLGLEVVLATDAAPGLPSATPQLVLDLEHPETVVRSDLDALGRLDAVVGVDEAAVLAAAELALRLGLPGNPIAAARATRDKSELRRLLSGSGLPQPRWAVWAPDQPPPELPPPCVVKPLDGAASFGVVRADSRAQLERAGEQVRSLLAGRGGGAGCPLLVESFVPGPEIAVEGMLARGELLPLAVYDKPGRLDGPYFEESIYLLPSRLAAPDQEAVWEVLAAATRALGLRHGAVHAEFRLGSGAPTLIDLASRSIGGRCSAVLRFHSGSSLEELVLRNALDLPLPDLALDPRPAGVLMLSAPGSGRLVRVRGSERALAEPGVGAVEITVAPGTALESAPGGDRYLGFVFAHGSDQREVQQSLLAARADLDFDLER